jgi:hypothetical protein
VLKANGEAVSVGWEVKVDWSIVNFSIPFNGSLFVSASNISSVSWPQLATDAVKQFVSSDFLWLLEISCQLDTQVIDCFQWLLIPVDSASHHYSVQLNATTLVNETTVKYSYRASKTFSNTLVPFVLNGTVPTEYSIDCAAVDGQTISAVVPAGSVVDVAGNLNVRTPVFEVICDLIPPVGNISVSGHKSNDTSKNSCKKKKMKVEYSLRQLLTLGVLCCCYFTVLEDFVTFTFMFSEHVVDFSAQSLEVSNNCIGYSTIMLESGLHSIATFRFPQCMFFFLFALEATVLQCFLLFLLILTFFIIAL